MVPVNHGHYLYTLHILMNSQVNIYIYIQNPNTVNPGTNKEEMKSHTTIIPKKPIQYKKCSFSLCSNEERQKIITDIDNESLLSPTTSVKWKSGKHHPESQNPKDIQGFISCSNNGIITFSDLQKNCHQKGHTLKGYLHELMKQGIVISKPTL